MRPVNIMSTLGAFGLGFSPKPYTLNHRHIRRTHYNASCVGVVPDVGCQRSSIHPTSPVKRHNCKDHHLCIILRPLGLKTVAVEDAPC